MQPDLLAKIETALQFSQLVAASRGEEAPARMGRENGTARAQIVAIRSRDGARSSAKEVVVCGKENRQLAAKQGRAFSACA
jgi:hypothetical protein